MCRILWGSPNFPLLFFLHMAEQMRSGNTVSQSSYADDIGTLGFDRTALELIVAAKKEVDNLTDWTKSSAILFDTENSEAVHFSGRKNEDPVGVVVSGRTIEPAGYIRWLGIHLDPRLSFKNHVSTWCGKAIKLAQHLRKLNSVKNGAVPKV